MIVLIFVCLSKKNKIELNFTNEKSSTEEIAELKEILDVLEVRLLRPLLVLEVVVGDEDEDKASDLERRVEVLVLFVGVTTVEAAVSLAPL